MTLLMALLFGAQPAPAFDVPIREVSIWLHSPELHWLLTVTPGRCQLWAPGQAEPTRVTARLNELQAQDLGSLLMVGLDEGYNATSWGSAVTKRPRAPFLTVTVDSLAEEIHDPVFEWTNLLVPTPDSRLTEAWRLYSLFSLCNLGEAVDVWVALVNGPTRQRHIALAVATEWMIWANREEEFVFALPELVKDCRAGDCEALPDALRRASRTWAESPSPRSFAPLERSPTVELPAP